MNTFEDFIKGEAIPLFEQLDREIETCYVYGMSYKCTTGYLNQFDWSVTELGYNLCINKFNFGELQ